MAKIYVLISTLILLALLVFSPLFSVQSQLQADHGVATWTAGPGSYD